MDTEEIQTEANRREQTRRTRNQGRQWGYGGGASGQTGARRRPPRGHLGQGLAGVRTWVPKMSFGGVRSLKTRRSRDSNLFLLGA